MGRQAFAVCPKCRKKIDIVDYTLDIDFSGSIRTAGTVRLTDGACILGGEIRAAIVELGGSVKGGRVVAWHRLVISSVSRLKAECVEFRDLVVAETGRLDVIEPLACRRLDVAGRLQGVITASDRITIRQGGVVHGSITCPVLIVEDGSGLCADVRMGAGS